MNDIETLAKLINSSQNAVVMTGAGISTASGIPDFRSNTGLYSSEEVDYEYMLSIGYFNENPDEFYKFFFDKMIYPNAHPNFAHKYIAELENQGHVKAVVTQNIDRLHQAAGSKNVIEVHGNLCEYTCTKCGSKTTLKEVSKSNCTPKCNCGGVYRPDIVFYGQSLNPDNIERSIMYIEKADLLIVIGTSLLVYPAAGFIRYKSDHCKLAIINRDSTPFDDMADIVIHDDIVQTAEKIDNLNQLK